MRKVYKRSELRLVGGRCLLHDKGKLKVVEKVEIINLSDIVINNFNKHMIYIALHYQPEVKFSPRNDDDIDHQF